MKKKLSALVSALQFAPFAVLAQGIPTFGPGGATSPLTQASQIIPLLTAVLSWFGTILGIISILVILYAALLFMIAGASEERRGKAKEWLKWGIVGIIVALFAAVIVPIVIGLLAGQI